LEVPSDGSISEVMTELAEILVEHPGSGATYANLAMQTLAVQYW
jgi:hypothetical protein